MCYRRSLQLLAGSTLLIPLVAWPQMPPQPAKLIVDSDPPNAPITVNGKKISQRTNATLIVSPGTYTVTVGDKNSSTYCAPSTVSVVSGQTATWSCSGNKWTQAPRS